MDVSIPILIYSLILTALNLKSCIVADSLAFNQFAKDINGDTLVSLNGRFELGFFSPKDSTNRYLGIWFGNILKQTIVWVANRESPISDSSGVLTISAKGKLVLFTNHSSNVVWSSNSSTTASDPILQLLDTGNLVVKESSNGDNQSKYIRQSFDCPGDSLLPGMKQGWDLKTGQTWYLTSWKSLEDPSTGDYKYELDPHELPQLYLRRGVDVLYRSSPWDGEGFSGGPRVKNFNIFKSTLVYDTSYLYYIYENSQTTTMSRRIVLQHSGLVEHLTWSSTRDDWLVTFTLQRDECDSYVRCGPNGVCNANKAPVCYCPRGFAPKVPQDWEAMDWSAGCVLKTPLNCSTRDGFRKFSTMKLPDNSYILEKQTASECLQACLRNCSCSAFAQTPIAECVMWFGDLLDLTDYSEGEAELYIKMAASELEPSEKEKIMLDIVPILTISVVTMVISVSSYAIWKRRSKRWKGQSLEKQYQDYKKDLELSFYDRYTVAAATDNFSAANKVGEGGFGPVYKGKLWTVQEIAVKRLSKDSGQGIKEFKNEVTLIAKLQHRNLVRLLGCCIQGEEKMLVYEYMKNRSLDLYIFNQAKGTALHWQKRFDIIIGVARGLLYLHRDSRLRIIHRDLKASNVLLDSEMNPKISDFGLARMSGCDETEGKTGRIMGTYGYMSPEYAIDGQFSVKSDVFSFGVLVLEIINGQRNREFFHPHHDLNLLGHAWKYWNEDRALELLDPLMEDPMINTSEVLRCLQVGLLCVQKRPEDRPTMSSVVLMLDSEYALLPQPRKPGYYTDRCFLPRREALSTPTEVTMTTLLGR